MNLPETGHSRKLAVSIAEAARLPSLSPRTIQNYLHAKLLPAGKIGRRTVIPVCALQAFHHSVAVGTLTTILTSVGVSVLVSALMTLLGQHLERRARREELILQKAIDMAVQRREFVMEAIKLTQKNATFTDDIFSVEIYVRWLGSLLNHGNLPLDADQFRRK